MPAAGSLRVSPRAARKPDWLQVLDTVAEKGDWGKPPPAGTGRGIAIHECFGTIVGEVAEVSVSPKGEVKVERVTAAVDCGHAVNPLTVAEQMEGGVVFGLSAALYGKITVRTARSSRAISIPTRWCGSLRRRASRCISR